MTLAFHCSMESKQCLSVYAPVSIIPARLHIERDSSSVGYQKREN